MIKVTSKPLKKFYKIVSVKNTLLYLNYIIMENREAMIIVDYQNDFAHEKGSLYVNWGEKLLWYINQVISEVKSRAWIIISTQDWHPINHTSFAVNHNLPDFTPFDNEMKWPVHCVQNSWGADFLEWLDTSSIDRKILKWQDVSKECYSWFWWIEEKTQKTLLEVLQEQRVKVLHIVWLATDFCVYATVEDAIKNNFQVNLHSRWIAWVYPTPESYEAIPNMKKMWAKILS